MAATLASTGEAEAAEAERPLAAYAIVYEDEHLVVVDKPAGVVVHPARGHRTGTLSQALAGRSGGGEADRAGIVHRLDRDTSGLLVVARTEDVHRALKSLLSSRRLSREYVALVDGHPPARSGTIDAPIGRDRRDRLRISLETDSPRRAVTHFEVRERLGERDGAGRQVGDRPDASDPGAPGGHRSPGVRGSAVRHGRALRPRPPVSARRAAGLRSSRDRSADRRALAAARRIWRPP